MFDGLLRRPKASPNHLRTTTLPQKCPQTTPRRRETLKRPPHTSTETAQARTPHDLQRHGGRRSGSAPWALKTPTRPSQQPSEGSRGSPEALPDPSGSFQEAPEATQEAPKRPQERPRLPRDPPRPRPRPPGAISDTFRRPPKCPVTLQKAPQESLRPPLPPLEKAVKATPLN